MSKVNETEEKVEANQNRHTWGQDGFCIYCHNVHRTDGNARSTCSDGFKCKGSVLRTVKPQDHARRAGRLTIEKNPLDPRDTYFRYLSRLVVTSENSPDNFYSVLFVNNGETCTNINAKHKTLRGAHAWAAGKLLGNWN